MGALTKRQEQVLRFCWTYWRLNFVTPTRQEIAAFFEFKSPNAAEEHLRALERKGAIQIVPGKSRGIRFKEPPPADLNIRAV